MKLVYVEDKKLFIFYCSPEYYRIPKSARFEFSVKTGLWYTQNIDKASKLRKYASRDLQERFKKYDVWVDRKIKSSYNSELDINIPKPKNLKHDYFPYQKAGIKKINENKYTLLADETGLGKTVQVIGAINMMRDPKRILIICPNSMKGVWEKELKTWCVHGHLKISISNSTDFKLSDIMIVNYETFKFSIDPKSKDFRDPKKGKYNCSLNTFKTMKGMGKIDLLVLDESQRIKNYSANTTRNIFKLKSKIGVDKAVFLSATPIFSRPDEIWTTIKYFGFEDKFEGNKSNFMSYYQSSYFDTRWNRLIHGEPKNLDELQRYLRSTFMIRRTKDQVFPEMPKKIRKIIPIEVDTTKFDKFDYLISESHNVSTLSNDDVDHVLTSLRSGHIGELAEMRMIAGEQKLKATKEYVDDLLDSGEKVVIFGHHKKLLASLKNYYSGCAFITGDVPSDQRLAEVEKFQNDPECKVFIGNIQSAGVGLTLTSSCHAVFVELDFVPANMTQAEDRIYRIGQKRTSFIHYLVAKNTLDAYIADMIIRKQDIFDKMIERENLTKNNE